MKINIHFWSYLSQFSLEWKLFQIKFVDKIKKTRFVLSAFFSKIVPSTRKRRKILQSRTGHRWQYGTYSLHAGYLRLQIHKFRLCNTHCFSTATFVARTRLKVTLYVHCLSCLYINWPNSHSEYVGANSIKMGLDEWVFFFFFFFFLSFPAMDQCQSSTNAVMNFLIP
jgi:hypothetical protein